MLSQGHTVEEITEGKEYWFGLPFCGREANEAIRGDHPIAIWISSKVDTRATVSDAETGTLINVVIRANQITQVPYGDIVMNKESEVANNYGIRVTADDPISVAVYMSYKWSGEAYRVIPVEWLGREYVTLNMYQDQLTQAGEIRPPQILVIATEDNTKVTYRPTTETVKLVKKGGTGSVNLMKGQTFLILGSSKPNQSQDISTDLTGTYIQASKPIGVISGHTKAAFPRFQFTFLGRNGGFMRNMMTDMMWPIELLGKEYVSAPIRYTNRPRGKIQDDKGDLIRFVATEDNTIISQMRKDGSSFMQISPIMKKQQFYDIINQEDPAFYSANKKVLVGQYGKTWWSGAVTPITKPGEDQPQNPSNNGQGMLLVLAPQDHWTSYASWRSPYLIDNNLYVTFDAKHLDKLFIATGNDKPQKFSARYGNSIKYIVGTPYAYITEEIAAGDHYILGDYLDSTKKEKAVFAAYAYGNWDRSKDGFAYGYPIGINYNTNCTDSLTVKDTMICANVVGKADVFPKNADCAFLFNILPSELDNYDFALDVNFKPGQSREALYYLNVIDIRKPAHGRIKFQAKSGKTIIREFDYFPELVEVTPKLVDFGLLQDQQNVCGMTFKVTNVGEVQAEVKKLKLKKGGVEFTIKENSALYPVTFPFVLQKGDSRTIEACAFAPVMTDKTVWDSVIAELSCYETPLCRLQYKMGSPKVYIEDAKWENIPVGRLVPFDVEIRNQSAVEVVLTGMNWPTADKVIFPKVVGFTFVDTTNHGDFTTPVVLKPWTGMTFTTYYQPNAIGNHQTKATFVGNTTVDKLFSDWIGNSIQVGGTITGYPWNKRRVVDNKWVTNPYDGSVIIECTGNTRLDVNRVYIDPATDPDGVFTLDQKFVPTQLDPGKPVSIPATFKPLAEKDYVAKVIMDCTFDSKPVTVSATLQGTGIQPHIAITGYKFATPIQIGNSRNGNGNVDTKTGSGVVATMPLTVNNLRIIGPDAKDFKIDPTFVPNYPRTLQIGDNWDIPIIFTASKAGTHTAKLVAYTWDESKANNVNPPDQDAPDLAVGDLEGYGFADGLLTTNHDYGTIFKSLSGIGQVYLENTGTEAITITRNIDQSILGAVNYYNIGEITWRTEKGGLVKPLVPFDLGPGDKLLVDVKFSALDGYRTPVNAQIEYITKAPNDATTKTSYSNLTGMGKILKMVAKIPDNYRADPGTTIFVDYLIEKDPKETEALETANIKEFKAIIHFKAVGNDKIQAVYPIVKDCMDLIRLGYMTEGWTCEYATIFDTPTDSYLQVKLSNPTNALKGDGVLFRINMSTFLSDLTTVPLPCDFEVSGIPAQYVEVTEIPGQIVINPVCVNTLRLIQLSGKTFSLAQNQPNPVKNNTTIDYSVAFEADVNISLYNASGQKVATLINQSQKPATYQISFDTEQLGLTSGSYFYKMECGPFSDVKTLIITDRKSVV